MIRFAFYLRSFFSYALHFAACLAVKDGGEETHDVRGGDKYRTFIRPLVSSADYLDGREDSREDVLRLASLLIN